MIVFPNCKINLGLTIKGKRIDGYHDLETVFYPVGVRDVLEIVSAGTRDLQGENTPVHFFDSGLPVDGDKKENLCVKAYNLLKKDFNQLSRVSMHLHKAIPIGAGLGGGSSNGAFVLQLLNSMFSLNLTNDQLICYAAQLGSDCPFFVINKPCLATSRGEIMEEVPLDLSAYSLVLVNPGIHINTGWAFSQLEFAPERQTAPGATHLNEIILQPVSTWKQTLVNDFEKPVFASFPEVKKIKEDLYHEGAIYASLTGTGSTVYGLFEKATIPGITFSAGYTVMIS
ncbi:MAG: 4-(cytidine 5'-diphospho)-2-C-methyl-D-erythritol kinase [Chitinophagaceae bacterium]